MRYWVTPFQLSATALSTLNEAGLQPWPAEGWSALPDAESLLLYDSPDRLIAMVGSAPETESLTAQSLLQGYRRLLDWSKRPGQPLLAISQLQRLGPQALRSWFDHGDDASPSPVLPLPIPSLLASVCLSLLEDEPALLDCYHDLELRASLLGRDPDLRYQERLLQAGQQGDALLQVFYANQRLQAASAELENRLASRDTELREAREAAERSLLQLHQVQEELEHYFLADAEKQRQLEAGVRDLEELRRSKADQESNHEQATAAQQRAQVAELQALRLQFETRLAELEQCLAGRDTELREARETAETTLRQLHQQMQEERERHSMADAEKQRQLEAGVRDLEELRRSKAAQESHHEESKAAQERAQEAELQALRQQFEPRLAELEQRLAGRDTELREARETAETTLLQLHQQVQEERELHSMADVEKQRQLEAGVRDLEMLRRSKVAQESHHEESKAVQERVHAEELQVLRLQFETRLAELEQCLAGRDTELREARETAETTLRQLHQQMQEERERHSMADVEKQRQLEAGVRDLEELRRSKADQESNHEQATAAQQRAQVAELQALRLQFETRLAELEQCLAGRDTKLREAKETAETTLRQLHQQVQEERERHSMAEGEKQRQLEAGVRDLEELRRSKADQESHHEESKAVLERAHEAELQVLRLQFETRLAELEQCLAGRDAELREARETAEATLLQLHQQVQEERERHSMAEGEKQRQLEAGVRDLEELRRIKTAQESAHEQAKSAQASAHEQELEALRQRLEPQLAELEQRLFSRDTELREAREAAELSLLQLHQVQEELEHYFLADAEKQRQLEAGVRDLEELRRSKADQESHHEESKAVLERAHEAELQVLRLQFETRLAELEQCLAGRDTELREARETAETTLLQLHQQVEEERERHSMAEGEKQRQLEAGVRDLEELRRIKTAQESAHEQAKSAQASAHEQELEALRQRLEPQLAELEQRLFSRDTELREAREAAELSLLQLHQVQEELEHYFLADAEKQRQLEAGVRDLEELRRSKADQESHHEESKAVLERAHEAELQVLRLQFETRLAELEQCLAGRDAELREARETAEATLLQLHQQVQEERERHSMAEGEKQRQLEAGVRDLEELRRLKTDQESAHEQDLDALRQQFETQLADLEQRLVSRETQLRQAREEADMTFEQLHQAQEELEHYFLKARSGDQLAQAQLEQLQRAQSLMVRLNPDVLPTAPYPQALAVEVLSELPAAMPDPSLQTQALLSAYAASLKRASALLERARRS